MVNIQDIDDFRNKNQNAPEVIVKDKEVNKEISNMDQIEIAKKRHEGVRTLPQYRGDVYSRNNISSLPNLNVGDIFWATKNCKTYIVSEIGIGKTIVKTLDENATISTGLTIYDLNKQLVSKEPLFDWNDTEKVNVLNAMIENWMIETDNKLYMLYGRLLNYFTVISYEEKCDRVMELLKELLDNKIGKLISIDIDENNNCLEIWIRTDKSKAELLYLFAFDTSIVKI